MSARLFGPTSIALVALMFALSLAPPVLIAQSGPAVTGFNLTEGQTVSGVVHVQATVVGNPSSLNLRAFGPTNWPVDGVGAPYSRTWDTTQYPNGTYAVVGHASGLNARSVNVVVNNAAAPPTPTSTVGPTATPSATPVPGTWQPVPNGQWYWQLEGSLNLQPAQEGRTKVYDVDYEYTSASQVAQLKQLGQYPICYMDVGVWESYRPDANQFPSSALGANTGWNGERYLDTRQAALDQWWPIIERRMDLCVTKGFLGVEGDYQNNIHDDTNSSFSGQITVAVQEAFNRRFIASAHARGLAALLKNAPEYAQKYAGWAAPYRYDGAVVEQCFQYNECGGYSAFVSSGRPVFGAEYQGQTTTFCPKANSLGFWTNKYHDPPNGSGVVYCR